MLMIVENHMEARYEAEQLHIGRNISERHLAVSPETGRTGSFALL
jgi:hypothetical protein